MFPFRRKRMCYDERILCLCCFVYICLFCPKGDHYPTGLMHRDLSGLCIHGRNLRVTALIGDLTLRSCFSCLQHIPAICRPLHGIYRDLLRQSGDFRISYRKGKRPAIITDPLSLFHKAHCRRIHQFVIKTGHFIRICPGAYFQFGGIKRIIKMRKWIIIYICAQCDRQFRDIPQAPRFPIHICITAPYGTLKRYGC